MVYVLILKLLENMKIDQLNAKQISMGLIRTLLDGVTYLKNNAGRLLTIF